VFLRLAAPVLLLAGRILLLAKEFLRAACGRWDAEEESEVAEGSTWTEIPRCHRRAIIESFISENSHEIQQILIHLRKEHDPGSHDSQKVPQIWVRRIVLAIGFGISAITFYRQFTWTTHRNLTCSPSSIPLGERAL